MEGGNHLRGIQFSFVRWLHFNGRRFNLEINLCYTICETASFALLLRRHLKAKALPSAWSQELLGNFNSRNNRTPIHRETDFEDEIDEDVIKKDWHIS